MLKKNQKSIGGVDSPPRYYHLYLEPGIIRVNIAAISISLSSMNIQDNMYYQGKSNQNTKYLNYQ